MSDQKKLNTNITLYTSQNKKKVKKIQNIRLNSIKNKNVRIKQKVIKIKNQINQLNNINVDHFKNQNSQWKDHFNFKQNTFHHQDIKQSKSISKSANETAYFQCQHELKPFINENVQQNQQNQFKNKHSQQNKYQNQVEIYSPSYQSKKNYNQEDLQIYSQPMNGCIPKQKWHNNKGSHSYNRIQRQQSGELRVRDKNYKKNLHIQIKQQSQEQQNPPQQKQKNVHSHTPSNFRNLKLSAIVLPSTKKIQSNRYKKNLLQKQSACNSSGYIRKNDLLYLHRPNGMFSNKNSANMKRTYRNQRDWSMLQLPQRSQLLKKFHASGNGTARPLPNSVGYKQNASDRQGEASKDNRVDINLYDDQNQCQIQNTQNKIKNMSNTERNCSIGKIIKNMKLQQHYGKRMRKQLKNMSSSKLLQQQQDDEQQNQWQIQYQQKDQKLNEEQQIKHKNKNQIFQDLHIINKMINGDGYKGKSQINNNKWSLESQQRVQSQPATKFLEHKGQIKEVRLESINIGKPRTSIELLNTDDRTVTDQIQTIQSMEQIHYFMVHQAHKLRAQYKILQNFQENQTNQQESKEFLQFKN